MFIIINYDVDEKRCTKMMKKCRKYLHHLQRSVFVGELTEKRFKELYELIKSIIKPKEDSVIIYQIPSMKALKVDTLGQQFWIQTVL